MQQFIIISCISSLAYSKEIHMKKRINIKSLFVSILLTSQLFSGLPMVSGQEDNVEVNSAPVSSLVSPQLADAETTTAEVPTGHSSEVSQEDIADAQSDLEAVTDDFSTDVSSDDETASELATTSQTESTNSTTQVVHTTTEDADSTIGGQTTTDVESDDTEVDPDINLVTETAADDAEVAPITIEDYRVATASEMAAWIREGRVEPQTLFDFAYQIIDETNPKLNNVISTRRELALEEFNAMEYTGQPFYGVPILVKGLGHTVEGGYNSNGLEFMKDNISTRSGSFTRALQDLGFVVLGQTSYPQFGWINVTNSDLYGDTHNPWDLEHNPGGSSGGSSAAVSIGQVPIASASDAGGSTRIPASWSGLIGLHPTRGVLLRNSTSEKSQTSHFAMTKSMEDTRALFEGLLNPRQSDRLVEDTLSTDLPIAYSYKTPAGTPIDMEAILAVKNAVEFLNEQGYTTVEVDYPIDGRRLMLNYYTIAASGASSINFMANQKQNLGRDITADDVELLTWALYQMSQKLNSDDVNAAWEDIRLIENELSEFYKQYPILLTATTSTTAPSADYNHIPEELIPLLSDMSELTKEEGLNLIYDQWLPAWTKTPYTQLGNLTGTPSLSLPTHVSEDGLPLGILFGAEQGFDRLLLDLGDLFESQNELKMLHNYVKEPVDPTPPVTDNPNDDKGTPSTDSSNDGDSTNEESDSTDIPAKEEDNDTTEVLDTDPIPATSTLGSYSVLPATGEKQIPLLGIAIVMLATGFYFFDFKFERE